MNLNRLLKLFTLIALLATTLASWRPAYAQSVLVVDDDGQASATDCNASQSAYDSIQNAVNVASPGDTVLICPAVYNEQVVITTSTLTILGSGMEMTIIRPSAVSVNSTGTNTPFPVSAILLISGATGVTLKDLTVDGNLADGGAANVNCLQAGFYMGIYYRNSSGTVESNRIANIRSGTRCSAGLSISAGSGMATNMVIKNNLLENYGSEGIRCGGTETVCHVTGNTLHGRGSVVDQIQGGIIFRGGAGGVISSNTITDHFYAPAVGIFEFSIGIALFNAEPDLNPHLLQNNFFNGNQLDVQRQGTAQTVR